ncbi:MAG: prolyl oligopeptidase family serine peptidase [Gemmatimonadetes bacterium]|nr:prolyl oligopeptidase family serine peptidase [Gemmatimonadota bacterium]
MSVRRNAAAPLHAVLALVLLAAALPAQERAAAVANPDHATYVRPPAAVERILRTDKNYATLEYASPDGRRFVVPHVNELSTLELMSRPTYRLAELELRPGTDRLWHLDTWGVDGVRIYSLPERRFVDVALPAGSFASDFTWSPDGGRLAFLAHLPARTEVWVADAASGATRSWSGDARVLATLAAGSAGEAEEPSDMIQWTPEGTLITLLVPSGRGAEPAEDPVPVGPVMRRTRDEAVTTRTFPNLLDDEHDERLFEHYTASQMAELAAGRAPRALGAPAMWESIALSPDGRHVLATRVERPFSYITSYRGFPRETVVLDRNGAQVASLEQRDLDEGGGFGGGGGDGPRDFRWRPDGAGLSYLARAGRNDGATGARADSASVRPDRIHQLPAPFELADARVVAGSEDPIRGVVYDASGRSAFATVSKDGEEALVRFDLGAERPEPRVLVDFHGDDDPLELPGELLTRQTSNGIEYALVSSDGSAAYLQGDGYRADFRPRPFVDRLSLADGSTERVFEGSADAFERPLVPLDPDLERMIVSRESPTDFPDSYLWTRSGGFGPDLTENQDPFPEITAAERMDFSFTRRDGLEVQGRVSMPVGWRPGDPPVPAVFWTYPREYEEAEEYEADAVESRNHNRFTHMSWLRWSDIWLSQGYALVYPDIPIVGENYNDTYIASLVDAMYGAIRAVDGLGVIDVDRIGHGGHSYGAFATANILANAPFFKAGIAGDGAYNRSLTPSGFQAERRTLWEAPHTYVEMSPFFRADQIETPLLMYHGGDDNNTGTFPVQSRRMIHALTALGKTAVLYEYPFESHTPRALENKLDMWARFIEWFDRYVKDDGAARAAVSEAGEARPLRRR